MRIRLVRGTRAVCVPSGSASASMVSAWEVVGECSIVDFAMNDRARESAPPINVVGVADRCLSVVPSISFAKLFRSAVSTVANGLYLFGLSGTEYRLPPAVPFISTSPFWFVCGEGGVGVGYRKHALFECDAITATLFAFPEARCAFMKTRMFARALESGRVEER